MPGFLDQVATLGGKRMLVRSSGSPRPEQARLRAWTRKGSGLTATDHPLRSK